VLAADQDLYSKRKNLASPADAGQTKSETLIVLRPLARPRSVCKATQFIGAQWRSFLDPAST